MNQMMKDQNKLVKQSRFGNIMGIARSIQLSGISSQLDDVLNSSSNITTGMEAKFVQLRTSAKPFAVQMGLMGKAARKEEGRIVRLAEAMNVGAESVGKISVAFRTAAPKVRKAMDAQGIGIRELIKIERSFGISGTEFIETQADLTQSWDFGEKALARLNDRLVAGSAAVGMTGQAFQITGKAVKILDDAISASGKGRTAEQIEQDIISTNKLAGAFLNAGQSQEAAGQSALKILKAVTGEQIAQEHLMAGLGGEFSGMFKDIAREVGFMDAKGLFALGPAEFAKALVEMEKQTSGNVEQSARFRKVIASMGSDFSFLLQHGDRAIGAMDRWDTSLVNVDGTAKDVTGSMLKMAKQGFSTGRTLADEATRNVDLTHMTMRAFGKIDMRRAIKNQEKAMKGFSKKMKEVVAKGGPMADFIKTMSLIEQGGIKALFFREEREGMSDFAAAAGAGAMALKGIMKQAGPLMPLIGPLLPALGSALFSWPGMAIAAVAGAVFFKDEIIQVVDGIEAFFTGGEAKGKIAKGTKDMLTKGYQMALDAWPVVKDTAAKLWELAKKIGPRVSAVGIHIAGAIGRGISAFFASDEATAIGDSISQMFGAFVKPIKDGMSKAYDNAGGLWGIFGTLMTSDNSIIKVGRWIAGAWMGAKVLGFATKTLASGLLSRVVGGKVAGALGGGACMPSCGGGAANLMGGGAGGKKGIFARAFGKSSFLGKLFGPIGKGLMGVISLIGGPVLALAAAASVGVAIGRWIDSDGSISDFWGGVDEGDRNRGKSGRAEFLATKEEKAQADLEANRRRRNARIQSTKKVGSFRGAKAATGVLGAGTTEALGAEGLDMGFGETSGISDKELKRNEREQARIQKRKDAIAARNKRKADRLAKASLEVGGGTPEMLAVLRNIEANTSNSSSYLDSIVKMMRSGAPMAPTQFAG